MLQSSVHNASGSASLVRFLSLVRFSRWRMLFLFPRSLVPLVLGGTRAGSLAMQLVCRETSYLGRFRTDVNRGMGWVNGLLVQGTARHVHYSF